MAGEREYLTCERCADYRAVTPEQLDGVRALIERNFGYRASFTHFPIVGLCPSCVAAMDGAPRQSAGAAVRTRGSGGRSTARWRRAQAALTPQEWRRVAAMAAVVLGLHAVGLFILIALVAPHRYVLGTSGAFTVGVGLTAYTLGLRHAFDADHIAAIDNTTRKLMADGKRPLSVGFFFSLGHSTIVFSLAALFAVGFRVLSGQVRASDSAFHDATNLIGTGISAIFLFMIAALNIVILLGIVTVFRDMRRGRYDEAELERKLNSRGLMNRLLGRFPPRRPSRSNTYSSSATT